MTAELSQVGSREAQVRKVAPGERTISLARIAILVERASPFVVAAAAPIMALMIASLFDAWIFTPRWAHAAAIIAALALSVRLGAQFWRRDFWPSRQAALARLERDGKVAHDAVQALEDAPAGDAGPLWDAHIAEMKEKARAAKLKGPAPSANRIDRYGLRYAAFAAFVIGLIAAGENSGGRLLAGFLPADPRAGAAGYADLWIEPPAYTGKAPIYLVRASDALPGLRKEIEAPEGSIVHAQVGTRSRHKLSLRSPEGKIDGTREGRSRSARSALTLTRSGVLSLRAGGREGRWPIIVVDDIAPEVDFIEEPAADREGRLATSVRITDDYGAASAALSLRLDRNQPRPLDAPAIGDDALAETRSIAVDGIAGTGARSVALNLQADPWAGLDVFASVVVVDAAGQTGETEPIKISLPRKDFYNPLAKAVIEQRQLLAVAPGEWRRAEWAFNGLTLGPEYFYDRAKEYLLLRTAMWRINKEAGGDYKDAVEEFWPLALQLEDEALELARRRLDASREALREALENGADAATLERLTEDMRSALQQYLQALAEAGPGAEAQGAPAENVVSADDLEAMLHAVRDLAKSGAEGAARQALAELENLLDNLQPPGGQGGSEGTGEGGNQAGPAGAAGDMIGRQRELADKSFERGQNRGAVGDDLATEQGSLAGDLSELLKSLQPAAPNGGAPSPTEEGARALGEALGAMRRSEEALKGEDFDAASEAMERAIASLREGAEKLARGEKAARASQGGEGQPMRDPLGRPIGPLGDDVEVPEKSEAQRTRELLEELRRRLSDGERTEDEIKYLERLLERF